MIKNEATEGSANRVSLGLKCGDCVFLNSGMKRFEQPCGMLGQEPFSHACPEFSPDMRPLMKVATMDIHALAEITGRMSQNQLRLMAYVFRNMDFIRKTGLTFGQPVLFSLDGKDYLENYFRGVIVGASKDGRTVYITSDLEQLNKSQCMLTLMRSEIKTVEEFRTHHAFLVKKNRLRSPVPNKYSERKTLLQLLKLTTGEYQLYLQTLTVKPDSYVPPTIDAVPTHWLDSRMLDNSIKRKTRAPERDDTSTPEGRQAKPAAKTFKIVRYEDTVK